MRVNIVVFCLSIWMMSFSLNAYGMEGPIEEGKVEWLRDLAQAQELSEKTGRKILLFFQEVPGCGTCQRFGQEVLSQPLIVELIEDNFVPVLVYNNKGGNDKATCQAFGEPTWNNPVMRVLSADLKSYDKRLSGKYKPNQVVDFLLNELETRPAYAQLLSEELAVKYGSSETMTAAMYCFWSGESKIGSIDGVVSTEAGFSEGREVVRFTYNPMTVSQKQIVDQIEKGNMADQIVSGKNFRTDREPQYYLTHSDYAVLPLLAIQKTKINTHLAQRQDPEELLSPRQRKLFQRLSGEKNLMKDLGAASEQDKWEYIF